MGIVKDSRNPSDPFERKTSAQRSVRHPKPYVDAHNPKPKITTPVSTVDNKYASGKSPRSAPTGTTSYSK